MKLAIITHEVYAKEEYERQLTDFFGDKLEIQSYSALYDDLEGIIEADLFLISISDVTADIKEYIPEKAQIIYITRTFELEKVDRLNTLPQDSRILILDYSEAFAMETMAVLHEVGYKNFKYFPVYPDISQNQLPDFDYAINIGQKPCVSLPENADIIDIGWYRIDVLTFINITEKLGIRDSDMSRRIYEYAKKVKMTNSGVFNMVKYAWDIQNHWDTILDMVNDGIIVMDERNHVVHYNRFIEEILSGLGIQTDRIQEADALPPSLRRWVLSSDTVTDQLVDVEEIQKKLVVSKRPVYLYEELNGFLILCKDVTEIQNIENKLRLIQAKKGFNAKYNFDNIITQSENMKTCIRQSKKIAAKDVSVLITGESGVGKELFAQSLHNASARKRMAFVAVNCAALPTELLESELFGYEEGAFTGARRGGKKGLFEMAHRGTIFLDEIGEMPLSVQAKLLRVLQEKEVMRIGGDTVIPVDVRVIAASNVNFEELMQEGRFRKDLYYRLNVMEIIVPELRNRSEDIILLANHFLSSGSGSEARISDELAEVLRNIPWEGNVRELRNCVEYMKIMGESLLTAEDLPAKYKRFVSSAAPACRPAAGSFPENGASDGAAPVHAAFGSMMPAASAAAESGDSAPALSNAPNAEDSLWETSFFPDELPLVRAISKYLRIQPMGRRKLCRLLMKDGFSTTEYQIRSLLKRMEEKR